MLAGTGLRTHTVAMAKPKRVHPWVGDQRTATEILMDAVRKQGSIPALERSIGLSKGHLRLVLADDDRGFGVIPALKIRTALGIPLAALTLRHEPIGQVMDAELGIKRRGAA